MHHCVHFMEILISHIGDAEAFSKSPGCDSWLDSLAQVSVVLMELIRSLSSPRHQKLWVPSFLYFTDAITLLYSEYEAGIWSITHSQTHSCQVFHNWFSLTHSTCRRQPLWPPRWSLGRQQACRDFQITTYSTPVLLTLPNWTFLLHFLLHLHLRLSVFSANTQCAWSWKSKEDSKWLKSTVNKLSQRCMFLSSAFRKEKESHCMFEASLVYTAIFRATNIKSQMLQHKQQQQQPQNKANKQTKQQQRKQ